MDVNVAVWDRPGSRFREVPMFGAREEEIGGREDASATAAPRASGHPRSRDTLISVLRRDSRNH